MNNQVGTIRDEVTVQNGDLRVCVLSRSSESPVKALSHWAQIALTVLLDENVSSGQLDIAFVTSGEIAALNAKHMGKIGPTDVLAFPLDSVSTSQHSISDVEAGSILLGDVVINVERAFQQAVQFDVSIESEISLLLIHGVLHVLGYDHQERQEREQMEAKERDALAKIGYQRRVNQ